MLPGCRELVDCGATESQRVEGTQLSSASGSIGLIHVDSNHSMDTGLVRGSVRSRQHIQGDQ